MTLMIMIETGTNRIVEKTDGYRKLEYSDFFSYLQNDDESEIV